MDDDVIDPLEKVKDFIKDNLLIVIIFIIGLLLIGSGLVSMLNFKSPEVTFEPVSEQEDGNTAKTELMVDVSGAVEHPGVYKLAAGSRIQDALVVAGGLAADADREFVSKVINLAQKISDGEKLYIPKAGEEGSPVLGNTTASDGKININKATVAELVPLPGIGEVTAQKIISARPYASIDQLLEKKVVSSKVFEQIKESVSVY